MNCVFLRYSGMCESFTKGIRHTGIANEPSAEMRHVRKALGNGIVLLLM